MKIISRAEWGARSPRSRSTVNWSSRTEFVIHYSEGPTSQSVRSIQNFHMTPVPDGRGWSDLGYNFLVDREGKAYEGRGWLTVGAHATNHNISGIGVCFIGRNGDATEAAKKTIRALYDLACEKAGRKLVVRGHGQLSGNSTDCPGHQLRDWISKGLPVDGRASEGTSGAVAVPDGSPLLREGSSGGEVRKLQRALNKALGTTISADGQFGPVTRATVVKLQKKAGIGQDGIYGPRSAAALRSQVK